MECAHDNKTDKICLDCGIIIAEQEFSNGWWHVTKNTNKITNSMIQKLIIKGSLDLNCSKVAIQNIFNLKQKQKRINFFPVLLANGYDPYFLIQKLKIDKKEANTSILKCNFKDKLHWNWTNLLQYHLEKNKLMDKFDVFKNILLNSNSKEPIIKQINTNTLR